MFGVARRVCVLQNRSTTTGEKTRVCNVSRACCITKVAEGEEEEEEVEIELN